MEGNKDRFGEWRLRSGKAVWTLQGRLDVADAAELHEFSKAIAGDAKVKSLRIVAPSEGLALPGYQIIEALRRRLSASGREVIIEGALAPGGGRIW